MFRLRPDAAHNDASRLLRSLYDHVVTFAWLAANPETRLAVWRKDDLEQRLKIDREFAAAGERLLEDSYREQMKRDIAAIAGSLPDIASRAHAADQHWVPRIDGIQANDLRSFHGLYTLVFREQSGLVHATVRGLNHVTVDLVPPQKRVVLEAPLTGKGPYGMATVVYGVGLLVAGRSLGWPDVAEVEAIFARHP